VSSVKHLPYFFKQHLHAATACHFIPLLCLIPDWYSLWTPSTATSPGRWETVALRSTWWRQTWPPRTHSLRTRPTLSSGQSAPVPMSVSWFANSLISCDKNLVGYDYIRSVPTKSEWLIIISLCVGVCSFYPPRLERVEQSFVQISKRG